MMLQPPAQAFPSCRRERVSASVRPYGWRGIFPVLGLALAGCLAMQGPARAQEKVAKTSMIELYTSQGCKSCPRADRNFARYANDPHVLALSFHVNYWDYMGWRDTLATQENADRQTAYRRAQKARMVYTPQAIIDGRTQVNGRDMTAIEAQTAHRRLDVPVSIRQIDSNRLSIEIGAGEKPKTPLHVVLFYFRDPVTVPITAGENAGQFDDADAFEGRFGHGSPMLSGRAAGLFVFHACRPGTAAHLGAPSNYQPRAPLSRPLHWAKAHAAPFTSAARYRSTWRTRP